MLIKKFADCAEITAADGARLRETLSPHHDAVNSRYSLAHAKVAPGNKTSPHALAASEVYFIIKGRGTMHIGEETAAVELYDTVYIPPRAVQWIANTGNEDLEFLCLVDPAWRAEDEIKV
ncbi:MAG: cupin domain-containing protein [Candidatus Magasanikbacteria bacterium]|nr:cupin domain-containing protein [Candidatus Magasanikbacteria bacterium]